MKGEEFLLCDSLRFIRQGQRGERDLFNQFTPRRHYQRIRQFLIANFDPKSSSDFCEEMGFEWSRYDSQVGPSYPKSSSHQGTGPVFKGQVLVGLMALG